MLKGEVTPAIHLCPFVTAALSPSRVFPSCVGSPPYVWLGERGNAVVRVLRLLPRSIFCAFFFLAEYCMLASQSIVGQGP